MKHKLNIEIQEEHPAYEWAKKQSDSVNALGHIGTHIDCYSKVPTESHYELDVELIDCLKEMPSKEVIENIDLKGKAVILYTDTLNKYGYGSKEYGEANTFLTENVLDFILSGKPRFIVIDSCGIGNHGEEHIKFDKKCEKEGCFVIENILINDFIAKSITQLEIKLDINNSSSGKPCEIYAICKD